MCWPIRTRIPVERNGVSDCPRSSSKEQRTDARHVEAVEEGLDGAVNVRRLALALELEDSLGDRRHDGVMSSLDVGEDLCKPFVVVVHLWWPFDARVGVGVVPV